MERRPDLRSRRLGGEVDWPAWLDAGHAATNLAMEFGPEPAIAFLADYAALTTEPRQDFWLVMDAVGFLARPGQEPLFGSPARLQRLDAWVHHLLTQNRF